MKEELIELLQRKSVKVQIKKIKEGNVQSFIVTIKDESENPNFGKYHIY